MTLFSAEAHHLLTKRSRQNQRGLDVFLAAVVTTLAFALNFIAMGFNLRYESLNAAVAIGPCVSFVLVVVLSLLIYTRYRRRRTIRLLLAMAIGTGFGAVAGMVCADKEYWEYAVRYYSYQDMASYTNVDPSLEVGQTFMDAGVIYFRDGSAVHHDNAIAFHNHDTYCVAPILRPASLAQQGDSKLPLPPSGTVDFWAVGLNCCGENGENWTCGTGNMLFARSGIRLLNDHDRSMFLLGVQQWAANARFPARHPLFFEWVADPITEIDRINEEAWDVFWIDLFVFIVVSFVGSFLLVWMLQKVY